ncbi:MAG: VTT domain-containing protein [Fibrobacterota bacterium]|nr:VTT domain-containing protein [Fibrobacterota bacterium]
MRSRRNILFVSIVAALALGAAAYRFFPLRHEIPNLAVLTTWLEDLGPWGPFYWILIVIAAVVLLLPIPMIAVLSGFLFGPFAGPLYSLAGMEAGCTIAFLLGRFFLSGKAGAWLEKNPRLKNLNRGLGGQGWAFILSTRLLPGFPVKISNYAFGGLGYPLGHFMVGNLLGLIPYQIAGALAGSLLSDISEPGSMAKMAREPLNLAVSVTGLIAAIILLVYCVRRAVRSMRDAP